MIRVKRVYDPIDAEDGMRILVDRLWPRGISREQAQIDEWYREIAPSTELRKWFNHWEDLWEEFRQRYKAELAQEPRKTLVKKLHSLSQQGNITLLYSAKDPQHNNAVVLLEVLKEQTYQDTEEDLSISVEGGEAPCWGGENLGRFW